ncbi:DUF4326 domain-containing protein [Synechococcus sp. J7-Johnson]|nr:DUF4326 domain-containing protein [Synechococcus sp. J7-Johnson]MCP9841821.1 DUF4326 domain-containing protein [Synechococcus sp. J7-Johnson]
MAHLLTQASDSSGEQQQQAVSGRLELLCWCAPLACHAEVIRSALHWLAAQKQGGS